MRALRLFIYLLLLSNLLYGSKPHVVCSASIFSDMLEQLAGDLVIINTIVPIGGDPHIHEPTPRDAALISQADLIMVNGLGFEGWITKLITTVGSSKSVTTLTAGLDPIQSERYAGSADPHSWMTPHNGLIYITNMHRALLALIPEKADILDKNYKAYRQILLELDTYITEQIQSIPEERRILITSHDGFQYYGRRYGLRLEALIGISTEAEAQTQDVFRINRIIKEHNIPVVFIESTINPKLIMQIASDNKVAIGGKLYVDSIGDAGSEAASYIDLLKHNTDVIVSGLLDTHSILESPHVSTIHWEAVGLLFAGMVAVFLLTIKKLHL